TFDLILQRFGAPAKLLTTAITIISSLYKLCPNVVAMCQSSSANQPAARRSTVPLKKKTSVLACSEGVVYNGKAEDEHFRYGVEESVNFIEAQRTLDEGGRASSVEGADLVLEELRQAHEAAR
ncbi:hypothetical protein FOZ62_015745, partial [Perkinsus olseni]